MTPTRMALVVLTAALSCLTTAGCSRADTKSVPAVSTPPALSAEALESAPVPEACEHQGGNLVYGELPLVPDNEGGVWLARDEAGVPLHLLTDLRGAGPELLGLLDCSGGGVGLPQTIVLYAAGPELIGSIDLGAVPLSDPSGEPVFAEHVVVSEWSAEPGVVHATLESYTGAGYEIRKWSATLRWEQQGLAMATEMTSGPSSPLP